MHFRKYRKCGGEVSLSECIETGKDGTALSLMDVICSEEDIFEDLSNREMYKTLYDAVEHVLTPREQLVIRSRYGLDGQRALTQREVANQTGISRSYVSRRR